MKDINNTKGLKEAIDSANSAKVEYLGEIAERLQGEISIEELERIKSDLLLFKAGLYASKYRCNETDYQGLSENEVLLIDTELNEGYLYEKEEIKNLSSRCSDLIEYANFLIDKYTPSSEITNNVITKSKGRPQASRKRFKQLLSCSEDDKDRIISIFKEFHTPGEGIGVVRVIQALEKKDYYIHTSSRASLWNSLREILGDISTNSNLNSQYILPKTEETQESIKHISSKLP